MKKQFVYISTATVFFICALLLLSVSRRSYQESVNDDDIYYLPPAQWTQIMSAGYTEITADIVWIKTILYFAQNFKPLTSRRSQTPGKNTPQEEPLSSTHTLKYMGTIFKLDPYFRAPYLHGARLILYNQGKITRHTVEMSIKVLEQGMVNFPNDGELMFKLGFLYYNEIIPYVKSAKEKKAMKQKGARYIQSASTMDNAPSYASVLSGTILEEEQMDELIVAHLKSLLLQETNATIRERLEKQLHEVLSDQQEKEVLEINALYERWRTTLPFIPFELYTLLSSRPQKNTLNHFPENNDSL